MGINFWEARQAAKQGKTVQIIMNNPKPLEPEEFLCNSYWRNEHLDAEWEIVEEPIQIITVHQVFSDGTVGSGSYPRMDNLNKKKKRLSLIQLTTDTNGKLISARNV